jgi:hypothetical protein
VKSSRGNITKSHIQGIAHSRWRWSCAVPEVGELLTHYFGREEKGSFYENAGKGVGEEEAVSPARGGAIDAEVAYD